MSATGLQTGFGKELATSPSFRAICMGKISLASSAELNYLLQCGPAVVREDFNKDKTQGNVDRIIAGC